MKAALCTTFDGIDAIEIGDIDTPQPGPGEVRVDVAACALNFFDTLIVRNRYQYKPELPFSPSAEMAGVVSAVGEGVEGFAVGDRVCAYLCYGCARGQVIAPVDTLVKVPDAVSDAHAAGLIVTYGTAMHGLKDRGQVAHGETVAVLGASGGAGLAAIEVAKRLGARVIAAASSADKLEICRAAGADVLVDYAEEDLRDALKAASDGRGVDVVYDCVGGPYAEPAVRATAWGGRFLVIGFAAGEVPKIPLNLPLLKGCSLVGVFWGGFVDRDAAAHRANVAEVLGWVAEGKLAPHLHAVRPLEEIGDALHAIARREVKGKIILTID
ncbi:MAG: NADPH:quinone oxidoreductase family protein [Pseudomonadota bacterium]